MGFIPTSTGVRPALLFTGSHGVAFDNKGFDTGTIDAVGNTWNANVQGADASGHYTTRRTISGGDPNSSGGNFAMFLSGQKIIL